MVGPVPGLLPIFWAQLILPSPFFPWVRPERCGSALAALVTPHEMRGAHRDFTRKHRENLET